MKTIKVYAVGSHQTKERVSGVDFARVLQPMKFLDGYSDGKVKFKVDIFDIHKEEVKEDFWVKKAKEYDVIFYNYNVVAWAYAMMATPVHGMGKKIILDLDDAIWYVNEDNVVHDQLKELDAGYVMSCILDDVDGVVTTNGYLRNVIADKSNKDYKKILVAPNDNDLTLYNTTAPAKDTGEIVIMHYGSTSHFNDLLLPEFVEGLDKIMKEYPQVKFKCVGSFISEFRYKWGARYENDFGDVDIYKWVKNKFPVFMQEADIMVVPLVDNLYNRCKSDIKAMEFGSAMKPAVFSDTRPYRETIVDGETGYLAHTANDWYCALKLLIESIEERKRIGENLYNYVKEKRQASMRTKDYAEFIQQILKTS